MSAAPNQISSKRPKWLTILGYVALLAFLVGAYFALFVAPTETTQQELFRITYTHAAVAAVALLSAIVVAIFAAMFLWKPKRIHDVRAAAAAEVALVFMAVTVIGGMLYSKPTLGAFWAWDARITLSGIMLVMLVGYFVVRGMIDDPVRRGRVSAVVALVIAMGAPLNRAATSMFRNVHPARSADMPAELQFVLYLNMLAVLLVFIWFFLERSRLGAVQARIEDSALLEESSGKQEAVHV